MITIKLSDEEPSDDMALGDGWGAGWGWRDGSSYGRGWGLGFGDKSGRGRGWGKS